jgi:hypothetical protein
MMIVIIVVLMMLLRSQVRMTEPSETYMRRKRSLNKKSARGENDDVPVTRHERTPKKEESKRSHEAGSNKRDEVMKMVIMRVNSN